MLLTQIKGRIPTAIQFLSLLIEQVMSRCLTELLTTQDHSHVP